MDKNEIIEISKNVEHKSNKLLIEARDVLLTEYDKTKNLIIELTHHLDSLEKMYNKINGEIGKRIK